LKVRAAICLGVVVLVAVADSASATAYTVSYQPSDQTTVFQCGPPHDLVDAGIAFETNENNANHLYLGGLGQVPDGVNLWLAGIDTLTFDITLAICDLHAGAGSEWVNVSVTIQNMWTGETVVDASTPWTAGANTKFRGAVGFGSWGPLPYTCSGAGCPVNPPDVWTIDIQVDAAYQNCWTDFTCLNGVDEDTVSVSSQI